MRASLPEIYQAAQRQAKTTKSAAKKPFRTFQTDQADILAQPNAFIRRSLSNRPIGTGIHAAAA